MAPSPYLCTLFTKIIADLAVLTLNEFHILHTVAGEPITEEAWDWYYRVVGDSQCTIIDHCGQTGMIYVYGICSLYNSNNNTFVLQNAVVSS